MKYSIIIATTERETLAWVLQGILAQSVWNLSDGEVIVVRDGVWEWKSEKSTPSPSFVKEGDNKRILFLETGKKVYAAGARNLGISQAQGEIIIFINDDTRPEPGWLEQILDFYEKNLDEQTALLGRVRWVQDLENDRFHRWLERNAQFDFGRLDRGGEPTWRHFYTSNVSVKKSLLEKVYRVTGAFFSNQFMGWGFEDIELGYRLSKLGMKLHYDQHCMVRHDDLQIETKVWQRTRAARKNAEIFERLHPEVRLVPRGGKWLALRLFIWFSWTLGFLPEMRWWREWKKAWINHESKP